MLLGIFDKILFVYKENESFYDMKEQPTVLYDVYYESHQWYNKQICKFVICNVNLRESLDFELPLSIEVLN